MRKLEDMNKLPVSESKQTSSSLSVEKKVRIKGSEEVAVDTKKQTDNTLALWFGVVAEFFAFNDSTH
jgi:hypothetical protein